MDITDDGELDRWARADKVLLASELSHGGRERYLLFIRERLRDLSSTPDDPSMLEVMTACDVASNLWAIHNDASTIRAERESINQYARGYRERHREQRAALLDRLDKAEAHRLAVGQSLAIIRGLAAHRDQLRPAAQVLQMRKKTG